MAGSSWCPVGTFSARFAAGARVRIFTDDTDQFFTGTVMPLKASGHAFGDEIDTQPTDWDHVEVRIDRKRVDPRADLVDLGMNVGDFVAFIASPSSPRTASSSRGTSTARPGVAVALALAKNVMEQKVVLPHRTTIMVTITEEVGHGASQRPAAGRRRAGVGRQRGVRARASIRSSTASRSRWPTCTARSTTTSRATCCRLAKEQGIAARAGHLPLLPLRRGRRDRGGRQHPGRAGRLRARRQPRLGTQPPRLAGGVLPAAAELAAHAADVRDVGRQTVGQARRLPVSNSPRRASSGCRCPAATSPSRETCHRGSTGHRRRVRRPESCRAGGVQSSRAEPGRDLRPSGDPTAAGRLLHGDRHPPVRRPRSRCSPPDAYIDYRAMGGIDGQFPEVKAWLAEVLPNFPAYSHLLGNFDVRIDGRHRRVPRHLLQPDGARRREATRSCSAGSGTTTSSSAPPTAGG